MCRVHAVGTPMSLETGNEDRARSMGRTHHRRQMDGTTPGPHAGTYRCGRSGVADEGRIGFCDILVYIG